MRLSIFPKCKHLPSTKEEKTEEAKYSSSPHVPEIVDVETENDLIRIVTSYAWSNSIFDGTRKKANFKSCDFLVLDIDEGLTIDEAFTRCEDANITTLCLPSTNHTSENHRYRLIFPLSRTINSPDVFVASMEDLYENFPEADRSTITDYARFFFGGRDVDGFFIDGDLLEPIMPLKTNKNPSKREFDPNRRVMVKEDIKEIITELYGEEKESIPEAVSFFIENAHTGLAGEWTVSLNSFSFVLSLQGVELDVIMDLAEFLAPRGKLTDRDISTIERAYKDGEEVRENEPDLVSYSGE